MAEHEPKRHVSRNAVIKWAVIGVFALATIICFIGQGYVSSSGLPRWCYLVIAVSGIIVIVFDLIFNDVIFPPTNDGDDET